MFRIRGLLGALLTAAACVDSTPPSTAICDARSLSFERQVSYADPVDLLFVIDDSPSMQQEREHFLERQLPAALDVLFGYETGALPDLHIAVISTARPAAEASEPAFVWHFPRRDDPTVTAAAVRGLADAATDGAPVSRPLDAALGALASAPRFSRAGPFTSKLVIVILTDRDDCSTGGRDVADPLECIRSPQLLRAVESYASEMRAQRPGRDWALSVGIIAGVPPRWNEPLMETFSERFRSVYDDLLADPSMQLGLDESGTAPRASCVSSTASASAPRRLVQFARELGAEQAFVRSICDYDLAQLLIEILTVHWDTAWPLGQYCLRTNVVPDSQGFVSCRMTWELPTEPDPTEPLTPTRCDERSQVLSVPREPFPQRSARDRVLCEVRQTHAVRAADGSFVPEGEGFYFDPEARKKGCPAMTLNVTKDAWPPSGIRMRFECVDGTQYAEIPGAPPIGTSCLQSPTAFSGDDVACGNPGRDRSPGKLFCHPDRNRCVMACDSEAQCPPDWTCGQTAGLATRVCLRPRCDP